MTICYTAIQYYGDFLVHAVHKLNAVILPWFSSYFQNHTVTLPIFYPDFNITCVNNTISA